MWCARPCSCTQGFILKPATNDAVLRARTAPGPIPTPIWPRTHTRLQTPVVYAASVRRCPDALLGKLAQLNQLLVHWCGDPVEGACADLPATVLVTALAPCANGACSLGLTAILKHLQSFERLVLRDTPQHDARFSELRQILALQHQWLRSFRSDRQAQLSQAEHPAPQPHASAFAPPLIRIPVAHLSRRLAVAP